MQRYNVEHGGNPSGKMPGETRRKMSEAHRHCKLRKHVPCVETGETFASTAEAAKALGLSQGNVSAVARGVRKHSKGYHFRYIGEVTH